MTSEERFELPKQPEETCPMIDKVLKKISAIEKSIYRYERDDDEDALKERLSNVEYEVSFVADDLEAIRKHVEAVRAWGQAWKEKALELARESNFNCTDDSQPKNATISDDYTQYRGRCKEFVDKAVANDPTLRAVRGYYHCPIWGKQQHWWCIREDGSIFDPTVKQFPTKGVAGEYEEFNGYVECAQCNKTIHENDARFEGRYAFCSTKCLMTFVGL